MATPFDADQTIKEDNFINESERNSGDPTQDEGKLVQLESDGKISDVFLSKQFSFGDGSDGDVTISTDTTLTKDMFYDDLTVESGVSLNTGGYRIFVKGTLTNDGTIHNKGGDGEDGENGLGGNGGAAGTPAASGTLFGGVASGKGGNHNNGGANGENVIQALLSSSGPDGGDGSGGDGGDGGSATVANPYPHDYISLYYLFEITFGTSPELLKIQPSAGSGGGAGGSNDGAGGGGAGAPGGFVWIAALLIVNNGEISVAGGNGGDGGNMVYGGTNDGDGSGGSGGNGGILILLSGTLNNNGTLNVSGGNSGVAGNNGIRVANDGNPGNDGVLIQI